MFLQLMVLRRKRTSQKHIICILIIQIIVLKIQLQIITSKFQTSEVPSAIFGTMKPKKLENGRIPVSKPSEKVESDKQKYDKYVAKTQTSQNKQLEQEKQNDSVVKQGTASKSSDEKCIINNKINA